MKDIRLVIGDKNYSSWSMRPWVMLKQAGIEFEEVMVRFDGFDAQSKFKQTLKDINPVGKVPVLVDGDLAVFGELQGVGQEVLNDLADAEVISDKARQGAQRFDNHVSAPLSGHLMQTGN